MGAPKQGSENNVNPMSKTHDWVKVMSPSGKTKLAWVPKR